MSDRLGQGPFGSLKSQVDREIRTLSRENAVLRRARYSIGRRALRSIVVDRSFGQFLSFYLALLVASFVAEWAVHRHFSNALPAYPEQFESGFLKDLASYLIAGQIGILAIVAVAIAVVTLLSDRSNGASVNTDIRLYYVESYSYELSISSVALLIILTIQIFWPFHLIAHAIGIGGSDPGFKLGFSILHAMWFCVNLLLFLQFIVTTLRFVEPNARESLRERYSANEVIPRDATRRLLNVFYISAPKQMFGEDSATQGPGISFGIWSGPDDGDTVEIRKVFREPSCLVDVKLRPLEWVLRRWRSRVREHAQTRGLFGEKIWANRLSVTAGFGTILDGPTDLVVRRGQVALSPLEQWIVRRCLKFAPVSKQSVDMPTPDNFLEQLMDKLLAQIEQEALTGFRAAMFELVRYHKFILSTQSSTDEKGTAVNLAEYGGFMARPDEMWIRQYRRAFVAAADKIGSDTSFIDYLGTCARSLIPTDGLKFSQRAFISLLDLGVYEVIALEDWLTRRAVAGAADQPGASSALTGSDKRAYEAVVLSFVGNWEALGQALVISLALGRRAKSALVTETWENFSKAFSVMQAHLKNTAYFLASAVWNDDALGADRFRDLLLRWTQKFYANLQGTYMFSSTLLITPDLTSRNWDSVQPEVTGMMRIAREAALPGPSSALLLWEHYCDVVCVSGLVALHWYASGQQPSDTAALAGVRTLRQEKLPGEGTDLTQMQQKPVFRLLLDFVIRYALNPAFSESYSASIDQMIRYLTTLAEPRRVSGRVYSGFGIDGFDTLRSALLAAMAANLPPHGDNSVNGLIDLLKAAPSFGPYKTVQSFIWTLQQLIVLLDQVKESESYSKAALVFNAQLDLAAASARLKEELTKFVVSFEALLDGRLRAAPLDEARISLVRRAMTETVMKGGPGVTLFREYEISRDATGAVPLTQVQFGVLDRGSFTQPEMAQVHFDDLPGIFVEQLQWHLSSQIMREFIARPRRLFNVDISESFDRFWALVMAEAAKVGPKPALLVPMDGLGEELGTQLLLGQFPAGLNVTRDPAIPSGGGTVYMGTVERIVVYSTNVTGRAVLYPGSLLRRVTLRVVHGTEDIADFSFIDGEDMTKSQVQLEFGQRLEWAAGEPVEIVFNGAVAD